jgi:hypothetical protein
VDSNDGVLRPCTKNAANWLWLEILIFQSCDTIYDLEVEAGAAWLWLEILIFQSCDTIYDLEVEAGAAWMANKERTVSLQVN